MLLVFSSICVAFSEYISAIIPVLWSKSDHKTVPDVSDEKESLAPDKFPQDFVY